jgi:RNA polymerase sigma-70 factor (ECF subfamily)
MKSLKEEFLDILSNYQGILHKVNLVYFRDEDDRKDNFQEIVYQLWKSFPKLRDKSSIGSWIYSVSINTSITKIKKESKVEYGNKLPELADSIDTIEKITTNESVQLLLDAISKLNEIDKSIMLLYLEEKSYNEISRILGISQSNVGVRINRAKEIVKQNLNHIYHGK